MPPSARLEAVNPFDQKLICTLNCDDERAIDWKIGRAQAAFERWRRVPLAERVERVAACVERFADGGEEAARGVSVQMGKPIGEARREVETFVARARWAIESAEDALATEYLLAEDGIDRRIEHHPLGVVLDIAAWNYPLLVPVNVIVPALLAGNTVVLKHSERTPLTGQAIARAFRDPEIADLLTDVVVPPAEADRLVRDPRFAHVAVTGSVATGRRVVEEAAGGLATVGLELGGKDAAYVAADGDLDFAVANVVDGACYNAGQSCCAIERVYVHRSVHDEFVERARRVLEAYRMGDPLDETTTLGPLAIRTALPFLERQVEDAVAQGAHLLLGGQRVAGTTGNFFPPTLLVDVPNRSSLMQDESFAPILAVRRVQDDEEAIALMRDTRFGLTASVWTDDTDRAERVARELDVGTVFQNRCDYVDPSLPWSGWGESGRGATMSRYGFLALTRRKALHFRQAP